MTIVMSPESELQPLTIESAVPLLDHSTRQRSAVNAKTSTSFKNHFSNGSSGTEIEAEAETGTEHEIKRRLRHHRRQCRLHAYDYASKCLCVAIPFVIVAPWHYNLHKNCSWVEKLVLYLTSLLYAIILKLIPYSYHKYANKDPSTNMLKINGQGNHESAYESEYGSEYESGADNMITDYENLGDIKADLKEIPTDGAYRTQDIIVRDRTRSILIILLTNLTFMTIAHPRGHEHEHATTATVIALQLLCWLLLLDVRMVDPSHLSHFLLIGWILGTILYAGCAGVDLRTGDVKFTGSDYHSSVGYVVDVSVIMEYCNGMFFFTCIGMICRIAVGFFTLL